MAINILAEIEALNRRINDTLDAQRDARWLYWLAATQRDYAVADRIKLVIERQSSAMDMDMRRLSALIGQLHNAQAGIAERTEPMRTFIMMLVVIAVIFLGLTAGLGSAIAQEATPEFTPSPTVTLAPTASPIPVTPGTWERIRAALDLEAAMPYATAIIIALIAGLVAVAWAAIVKTADLAPRWVIEGVDSARKGIITGTRNYTKTTATPLDDLALDELERLSANLMDTIRRRKESMPNDLPPAS